MRLDYVFHDCQPEPGPAQFAASGLVHAIEPLEKSWNELLIDPYARVSDADNDLVFLEPGGHGDTGARGAVFDGVVQEIGYCLLEEGRICCDASRLSQSISMLTLASWALVRQLVAAACRISISGDGSMGTAVVSADCSIFESVRRSSIIAFSLSACLATITRNLSSLIVVVDGSFPQRFYKALNGGDRGL